MGYGGTMSYDNWLVAPYEQQEAENERYFRFCEEHDLETEDPKSEEMYADYCQEMSERDAEALAEIQEWQREHDDWDDPF